MGDRSCGAVRRGPAPEPGEPPLMPAWTARPTRVPNESRQFRLGLWHVAHASAAGLTPDF